MYKQIFDTGNALKLPLKRDAWMLFSFSNQEVIRLHLPPGDSIEKHRNDWRIVFFVLKGEGVLNVDGSDFEVGEQQSIAVEAGKERFWSNPGTQDLELLVIKSKEEL